MGKIEVASKEENRDEPSPFKPKDEVENGMKSHCQKEAFCNFFFCQNLIHSDFVKVGDDFVSDPAKISNEEKEGS